MARVVLPISLAIGLAVAVCSGSALAENQPKSKAEKVEEGTADTRELLRLMDKDKNGKVSKKEFMSFMEAEFDRLDTDKSGELDVVELQQLRIQTRKPGGSGSK